MTGNQSVSHQVNMQTRSTVNSQISRFTNNEIWLQTSARSVQRPQVRGPLLAEIFSRLNEL